MLYLIKQICIDFTFQHRFLIERLECILNVFYAVDEVKYKGICLALASPVQTGKSLDCFDALEFLIHYHGVEQRLIKSGLILLSYDEDIEVLMELSLSLILRDVAAILSDI